MTNKTAKADVTPVRQRTQYSCMSTSLMMCLQANGVECNEDEVNSVMGSRPMKGAAWEDAIAAAQHYGMRIHLICPATVKQLKEFTDAGTPVMIAWNPEGRPWSHASVVFDVDKDLNVKVADPNIPDPDETVRTIPKGDFYGKWYEKWPDYLVRRPAMAVEREVSPEGKQMVASKTAAVNEQLMNRASNLLSYMNERDAIKHLIKEGESRQDAFLAIKAGKRLMKDRMKVFEQGRQKRRESGYKGNPDGKDIYENEVAHGYGEPLAGGTDVMRKLQNQLLHEQGRPQRPESPRLAAQVVNIPGKGKVPIPEGVNVVWEPGTRAWIVTWNDKVLRTITDGDELFYYLTRDLKVGVKQAAVTEPEALDYLGSNMVPFRKGTGWWLPAHNFGVNQPPVGGLNVWVYTVLPLFPKRSAYVPPGDDPATEPEGIVLRPMWVPHRTYADRVFPGTPDTAEALVKQSRIAPSVGETTQREMAWIEKEFGVGIPSAIKSKYAQQAPKLAARRWGIDRSRTPKTFVPLDGRKPVPMPSTGRPAIRAAIRVANLYMNRLEGRYGTPQQRRSESE